MASDPLQAPNSTSEILATLRANPSSWSNLIAFRPTVADSPFTDSNKDNRDAALLSLHASHQTTPENSDLPLIHYMLDQEIRYHLAADHYSSSISLACYLLSRCRSLDSGAFWAMWAGRYSNFDASKCLDVHYLYYAAGGLEKAQTYVSGCTVDAVLEGAGEGRRTWWRAFKEDYEGDEGTAFQQLKNEVSQRIEHDRMCGVSDEKVIAFVEQSWRSETARWEESLLLDA
ncbi:hypothetical protein LshimejAT787_1800830 [Lyophyllum shimeji]|uniref:Uncharacterized protein n=1 Tax=Lyophyllum shimeji TaxID=47721 RepID=A0A9P3Q109_LYOSH|nr:hypothetical protein LshimejAT787_1800830 [Lyophyllum shimeji]